MTDASAFHVTKFRSERPGPRLLILAGVHGDEFEPMVAVKRLIRILRPSAVHGEVTLVSVLNRSAWQLKERVGIDGLDLARTFPGSANGSITQRVAEESSRLIREADYLIDLHTGGRRLRLWPLAGYMLHRDERILERQRAMAQAFNLPVVWGTTPDLEGRTLSCARDAGVPAIYVEYGGGSQFCRTAVRDLVDGCLRTMAAVGILAGEPAPSRVAYLAEDDRPNAGVLQICHPAPHPGVFEPSIELGQQVSVGHHLGRLHDDATGQSTDIVAGNSGRLVCLATRHPVSTGFGLAVIVNFRSLAR